MSLVGINASECVGGNLVARHYGTVSSEWLVDSNCFYFEFYRGRSGASGKKEIIRSPRGWPFATWGEHINSEGKGGNANTYYKTISKLKNC